MSRELARKLPYIIVIVSPLAKRILISCWLLNGRLFGFFPPFIEVLFFDLTFDTEDG
ncbi:MAG: hypothetical protein OXL96_11200 [Candidatus Poribacteria bacterium]|nr:hypothetical protein [Candidatus Poribacteria bacterium]